MSDETGTWEAFKKLSFIDKILVSSFYMIAFAGLISAVLFHNYIPFVLSMMILLNMWIYFNRLGKQETE